MTTAAEKAIETEKTTAPDKRKALGRGLESLLPGGPRVVAGTATGPVAFCCDSLAPRAVRCSALTGAPRVMGRGCTGSSTTD